jgi:hypothetical protein
MAYVGRGIDNISNATILHDISFTNSAGPYNLTSGSPSAAFTPISAQALVISVDGVIQDPASYTISGTTITFGVSMASTLTNDFTVHNGVGLISEPSDGSVTTAKLGNLAVTAAKLATDAVTNIKVADDAIGVDELSATGTASSSTYLRGDNAWSSIAADTNDKVSVSADDTTPGYLNGKLVAGTNISLTEGSGGGDETLTAAFTGNLNASVLNAGTVATARLGSRTASSSTILYGDQTYKAEPTSGLSAASQWRLTADLTGDSTEQVFTANLEVADTDGYGSLGSAMTESSGVFTFPSTGYWLISLHGYADLLGDSQAEFRILTTVNDATYDTASEVGMGDDGSNNSNNGTCSFLFDVTSTANCKVKFACHSINSDGHVFGDSSQNETHFTFTRLGDT